MKNHTTFKIGGGCEMMVKINCEKLLRELIACCKENEIPFYIIGRGSNILVSDKGLKGVVLLLGGDFATAHISGDVIECQAGATLAAVCSLALANSLTGLEFAYGIPGTVGGAVYMNAGAYGGEMKDVIQSCRYLDENGAVKTITCDKMELGYRHSIFSDKNYCITSVALKLEKGDPAAIKERMDTLMSRRKEKQPLEYPSAGSTFKRPAGDFAARLIEASNLKGVSVGDAQVSEKHSGFIINKGNAGFDDVCALIEEVKNKVYNDSGVMLECEVLIME
ncbi:MAG: UDP-N-acetylmuramate dehydrogenase [Eubacterium sp.]|nr:UDP-N-acetylmuramate dehydrogenase [Eubacterium sp.]